MPAMNEESLFAAALEIEDTEARNAFLNEACQGDEQLRQRVSQLLHGHAESNPLDRPLVETEALHWQHRTPPIIEKVGSWVGPYKLLEKIGEGGFGLVFVAEQEKPVRRRVALKVIKPGMDSSQVIARFEAERQALAMMDHVNIAKVLDAGTTASGRPYFVMELVHGVPITTYCDENRLTPWERLELFAPVCHAIQHAHHKGIIHRDIKPSNVLVTLYDDRPVPKVIDFGVAKAIDQRLTEKTVYTQYGTMVGTLEYVSPEQAEMNAFGVDTRSDVYSLGVLLYELLTGTTPLDRASLREAGYGEIIRLIKEQEPPRPSIRLSKSETLAKVAAARRTSPANLSSQVHGELDWIVMRCLEKDRTRRYESANALAKDIQHYLADEPVDACPPSLRYRLQKTFKRNRPAILTVGTIAAALLLATAVSTTFAVRARHEQSKAEVSLEQARQSQEQANIERDQALAAQRSLAQTKYSQSIQLAQYNWQADNAKAAWEYLDATPEELRGWEWRYLNRLYGRPSRTLTAGEVVYAVRSNPDGTSLWAVTSSGTLKRWDGNSGSLQAEFKGPVSLGSQGRLIPLPFAFGGAAAFSPDGSQIALASFDWPPRGGRQPEAAESKSDQDRRVVILDANTGQELLAWQTAQPSLRTMAFSPDGTKLVVGGRSAKPDETRLPPAVWNAKTGEKLFEFQAEDHPVLSLSYSADGSRIVTGDYPNGTATIWDAKTGGQIRQLAGHVGPVQHAIFLAEDQRIATAGTDRIIRIWDASSGQQLLTLEGHRDLVRCLAVSPDGSCLVSGSSDTTAKLWNLATGELICELKGHPNEVTRVGFDPTGSHIWTSSVDTVFLWQNQRDHTKELIVTDWDEDIESLAANLGDQVITAESDSLTIRDAETGEVRCKLDTEFEWEDEYALRPDGKQLITSSDSIIHVWDAASGQPIRDFQWRGRLRGLDYSPDGNRILVTGVLDLAADQASAQNPGIVEIIDANTGVSQVLFQGHTQRLINFARFSPDGSAVISGGWGEPCLVWDSNNAEVIYEIDAAGGNIEDACYSADGSKLVTVGTELHLWDAETGEHLREFVGHRGGGLFDSGSVSISPDAARVVASGGYGSFGLWDIHDSNSLLSFPAGPDKRDSEYWDVSFSSDGSRIVMTWHGRIRILDAGPNVVSTTEVQQ